MLTVLYILSSTSTQGGASKSFMLMLEKLRTMGIEACVVLPNTQGLYRDLQEKGIPVTAFTYRMAVYPPCDTIKDFLLWFPRLCGRIYVNQRATRKVEDLCQQIHPSIIHTNVSVIDIGFRAARHLHIPHVWHIREYGNLDFHLYHYPTRTYQLHRYRTPKSYTICITRDIQCHNGLENSPTSRVIYNGILSSPPISPQNTQTDPFFLFAGHIEPAKGVYELLQTYAIYARQTQHILPLYIAGEICHKDYMRQLQSLISEQRIEKFVRFLGEQKDINDWEQHATAIIVPSISEGFGRVMPEAMYNKTLVIAHNTAGTKEQLDNGLRLTGKEIGLRYTTQEQLVQHLLDVTAAVHNGTFVKNYDPMIMRAKYAVQQLYTTEQNAQQVCQFYQDILFL